MINSLLILLLLALIYISISSKVVSYIYSTAFQAFILGVVALWSMEEPNIFAVILVFLETILIKGLLLPIFLYRILKKHQSARLIKSLVPDILNIVLVSLVIAGSFLLISQEVGSTKSLFELTTQQLSFHGFKPLHLAVAISLIAGGLILLVTRGQIFTMVVSFTIIENGIFLLTLSVGRELSALTHIGLLIDFLATILVLGLFLNKMGFAYSDIMKDKLTQLKD